MGKFKDVYDKLKKTYEMTADIENDANIFNAMSSDKYSVISEDTLHIIDEYVKDPELTPVPKEVLNFICSKAKFRRDNVFEIPMEELFSLLREHEYPFYQEFKQNLGALDGSLYVVMLFDRDFSIDEDLQTPAFNSTYQFLLENFKDENACRHICKELLKEKNKTADAICSKTDAEIEDDLFFKRNCLIFVSLKGEFLKDSLEHELTHFVQKTVGFRKIEDSIKSAEAFRSFIERDAASFNRLVDWLKDKITDDQEKLKRLLMFFNVKFNSRELHQSIKAILNGVQRIYEYRKLGYIAVLDFSKREIDKRESLHDSEFRLDWLKRFINVANSDEFIKDILAKTIVGIFDAQDQQAYLLEHRPYFIILLYFGFKMMFKSLDIDRKLEEHFKIFKYKDN